MFSSCSHHVGPKTPTRLLSSFPPPFCLSSSCSLTLFSLSQSCFFPFFYPLSHSFSLALIPSLSLSSYSHILSLSLVLSLFKFFSHLLSIFLFSLFLLLSRLLPPIFSRFLFSSDFSLSWLLFPSFFLSVLSLSLTFPSSRSLIFFCFLSLLPALLLFLSSNIFVCFELDSQSK